MKTTIAVFCTLGLVLPLAGAQDKAAKKAAKAGIDMEVIFKKIDGNNDGKLSKDEFGKVADEIREKGEKAAKIADRIKASANDLFVKLDENKDSSISLDEAKKFDIAMIGGGKAALKDLDATFKKLDKNNDSKLNEDEFAKVVQFAVSADPTKAAKQADKFKARIEELFAKLDENKDANLSADEFRKFAGLKGEKKPK